MWFQMSAGFISPLLQMIFAQEGAKLLGNIFGGKDTQLQKSIGQNIQFGQQLMPSLYAQAMGQPSLATQNTVRNLGQQINQSQQAYSASMQKANPGMVSPTTPVRQGQKTFQDARIRGAADIYSQAQNNAQNQLMAMYQGSLPYQQQAELQARQDQQAIYTSIGSLWNDYKSNQYDAKFVQTFKPLMEGVTQLLEKLLGRRQQSNGLTGQIDSGLQNYTPKHD